MLCLSELYVKIGSICYLITFEGYCFVLTSSLRAERSLELEELGTGSNSEASYCVMWLPLQASLCLDLYPPLHGHFYSPPAPVSLLEEMHSTAWGLTA